MNMKCPKCNGSKYMFPAFPHKETIEAAKKNMKQFKKIFKCQMCKGSGEVDDIVLEWMKEGDIIKDRRINKRILLRNAAKLLNIDMRVLSDMERGIIKPDLNINY